MKRIIIGALLLIIGMVAGSWLCRQYHFRDLTKMVQVDTVQVRDTIEIEKPVVKEVTKTERIYVQVRDTVRMRDTLYMTLQTEKKFYKDAEYYAEVSGYNPSLDYIEVYPKTTTIYKAEKHQKWHYDASIGFDIGRAMLPYVSPRIGAEIGYKRWSISGEAGCNIDIRQDHTIEPSIYYQIGLNYSLIKREAR